MKKLYILLFAILTIPFCFSQGTETFDGFTATGSSYSSGTFTGQDGSTWTFVESRGDQTITGKSLMLGRNRPTQSEVYSGTISGGVGTISFNYAQAFSTNVNLNVLVNGFVVGNVTTSSEVGVTKTSGTITVNQPGNVVIKFISVNNSDGQVTIDDIAWTGYSGAATPSLALSDGPTNGAVLTDDPETPNNANIDFATTNFLMCSDGTGTTPSGCDGYIKWEAINQTDGDIVTDSGDVFTSNNNTITYPVNGLVAGKTYFFRAELVDPSGNPLSSPVVYSFTITIATYNEVATIASLRSSPVDPNFYIKVVGEVYNTYSRASNNQKYFQDNSGGILVHDPNFDISTTYSEGDGVINMRGHLELYNGLLELIPTYADWGKSSTGNTITPQVVSIADVTGANLNTYESKLVRINGVTFADGNGINTFSQFANYVINDGTASTFRTSFNEADYIGAVIPSGPTDMLVIVGNFNGAEQFTARSMSELTLSTKYNQIEGFAVYPNPTSLGYVTISSKNNSEMNVSVFDMLGKQVLNTPIENNRLNVTSLTSGVYIMKVAQEDAISTQKLIIQ